MSASDQAPPGRGFLTEFPGAQLWWLDDDVELVRLVARRLTGEGGWRLTTFKLPSELEQALETARPDLLILDQMLPEKSGTHVLTKLRQGRHGFPVLMLSALGSPADRIQGLEVGADDYLAKPFLPRELQLRVENLLRQTHQPTALRPSDFAQPIDLGPLKLFPDENCLENPSGERVVLSRGDTALLLALTRAAGQVLTREQLAQASGSLVDVSTSRSFDVRLSKLRRLLASLSQGSLRIESVRSQGYSLSVGEEEP